jgi:hypothetical protein
MQLVDEVGPFLLIEMDNYLRICTGGEPVPPTFEALPKLAVVVDLAVEYDRHRPALVGDGLISRYEVDYAQTLDPQANAWGVVSTARVRAPVLDGFAHVIEERFRYQFPSGTSLACDAAHGLSH